MIESSEISQRQISLNKSDTMWNWSFNTPCKSLKASWFYLKKISHTHETHASSTIPKYKIQNVSVTVEGKPDQLYSQGMRSFEQYDEVVNISLKGG